MKTPPTKQERAAAILQCAHIIAEHFGTTADKLLSPVAYRKKGIMDARIVFAYHLHKCGISIESIARMLSRSVYSTDEKARQGVIFLMGKDREMIESLPRIPSSLVITPSKVA